MTPPRPNIVWIYLDQCRADVLGCYGHPFIRTPNLDRLAAAGVLFENAFCQNPVCVPSRASMLSGTYCHQTGVYENRDRMRPGDSRLLHGLLDAGYATANVGKVHLGISPEEAGFRQHRAIVHDGTPHMHVPPDYLADWPWRTFDAPDFPQPVIYATDMCPRERTYCAVGVTEAVDIFRRHEFGAGPLMLRLSLDRPHTPVTSPKPYDTMYADRTVLPEYGEGERAGQPATLKSYIQRRRWDLFSDEDILRVRSYYYGLVTHLDHEIGRLLDVIDASPERGNTIALLTADHGCMLGEHGLFVKAPHYHAETGRVPFILSWPGRLPAGRRVGELVEMVDLLPTLLGLCGVEVPQEAAGRSLIPLIEGRQGGREYVFAEQFRPEGPLHWLGVRTERYAYTRYAATGERMLFDLAEDPAERRNLMSQGAPAGVAENMEKLIAASAGA